MADLDQVSDLARPDDRLILGVNGSVSEYELSLFRQRSQEAIRAKATRGERHVTLPAGLGWTPDGQIELNPDRRGQQAIRMGLDTLAECGSVRQVLMWLRDETCRGPPSSANGRGRSRGAGRPPGGCGPWCAVRSLPGPTPSGVGKLGPTS